MSETPNFHDAVFIGMKCTWKAGITSLYFKLNEGEGRVIEVQLKKSEAVTLTQLNPWGESIYVNRLNINNDSERCQLWIQMQSGDVIIISAGEICIKDVE